MKRSNEKELNILNKKSKYELALNSPGSDSPNQVNDTVILSSDDDDDMLYNSPIVAVTEQIKETSKQNSVLQESNDQTGSDLRKDIKNKEKNSTNGLTDNSSKRIISSHFNDNNYEKISKSSSDKANSNDMPITMDVQKLDAQYDLETETSTIKNSEKEAELEESSSDDTIHELSDLQKKSDNASHRVNLSKSEKNLAQNNMNHNNEEVKQSPILKIPKSRDVNYVNSSVVIAVKKHPVRASRNKVITYNDIANSIDLDLLSYGSELNMNAASSNRHVKNSRKTTSSTGSSINTPSTNKNVAINYRNTPLKQLNRRRFLRTGFVYDTAMSYHATPDPMEIHPEDPRRIFKIFNILERNGLLNECKRIKSRRATKNEILLVHNIIHYRKLRETSDLNKSRADFIAMENDYDSIYLNSNSFESALYAVGSLIELVSAVIRNQIRNALAIIRPPGHHAESDVPMGFCLFNNVAIATKACMKQLNVKKILIVDWDIHFGNGTQSIFSEDPNVLYISLHRYEDGSFYPSDRKGSAEYTGHGKGIGKTVNIPWPCAGMTDADYIYAFREIVIPIAMEFSPDIVIVSAGFDAACNDPIGKCNVTPTGYGHMTHMLKAIANGKLVIALEGGYDLNSIAVSVLACMNVLLGDAPDPVQTDLYPKKECLKTIELVKSVQKKYWKCIS